MHENRPCWCWSCASEHCVVENRRFEAGWPAYAQGDAFVHLFTIICRDRFSKAGGRNPALWDKHPFVFNQSPAFNAKLFQMTQVKWKGGLTDAAPLEIKSDLRTATGKRRSKTATNFSHQSLAWFCSFPTYYWVKGSAFALFRAIC